MSAEAGGGFEETLTQLESRVRELEKGEIPLEEALKLFEEGMELARTCHEQLDAAEERVSALTRGPDGIRERSLS